MRTRWIAAVAVVLAVGASAACTASDDDAGSSSDDSGDDGGSGAPVTGVTADTVTLGVAGVDPAQLEELGIESDGPASQALYEAWVAAQNEQGGVAGRQIELVFRPFLPTGDAEAEAACVELTEDKQVFLVTGIFTDDSPLCFTEAHGTPYLGQFGQSAERDRRSKAPFVALEMSDDRQRLAGLQVFLDEGALDGRVALYWGAADTAVVDEFIKPALDEAGIDVVVETALDDFGGDQAAEDQALDTIVERIRAADPDVVLNVSDFLPPLVAFQRNGWLPDQVLSTSAQALVAGVLEGGGLTAATLDRVTVAAPYAPTRDELVDDPEVQRCVEEYNASGPDEPVDMDTITGDTLDALANECAAFRLFVLAAEAAGDDLTPASWGSGAESLGDLDLPGMPYASLGEDKHSAGDAIGRYEYDAADARMVATGPAIEAPA
jgi:ABC-type branched-subunit amino acid transport system substrate-binding protein